MKKIFAILLIAAVMLSLTGCFGSNNNTSDQPATEPPALETYAKDFIGLQQYLIDHGLVPYADLSGLKKATADEATPSEKATEAATQAPTENNTGRTAVYYDLLGADDGIRYALSGNAFIELYDFSKADNVTAKKTLADIKEDGKFTLIDGFDELTGVISKSGKFVALYNAKNGYDYDSITKCLENW